MDEVSGSRNVSCRQLIWLLALCRRQNIDPQRVLRGIPCRIEQLEDESQFIDWQGFTGFITNLRKYLSEEELLTGGIESWQATHLQHLSHAGRLLFSVRDQYLSYFGPMGDVAHSFPVQLSLSQHGPLALDIRLSMRPGCHRSRAFEVLIAGQLIGLPQTMGQGPARVEIEEHARSVIYHVRYDREGGLLTPFRKALTWLLAARAIAGELSETEDTLLRKYHELQEVSDTLAQASETIRAGEMRLNQFCELTEDAVWVMDDDLTIVHANPVLTALADHPSPDLAGQNLALLFKADSVDAIRQAIQSDESIAVVELSMPNTRGKTRWLRASIAPGSDHAGTRVCIARDITAEKVVQQQARAQSKRLDTITGHAREGILILDDRNRIIFANPATTQIFGYEAAELSGMDIGLVLPESLGEPRLHELYRSGDSPMESDLHVRGLRKDRTLIPVTLTFTERSPGDDGSRTCFIRDASLQSRHEQERNALEQQLHAAQKMESIGQLTGGIAHDFNNLLVAINGYSDLALDVAGDSAELAGHLHEIRQAAERAGEMTSRLLAFSRRRSAEPRLIDVGEVLDGLDLMLRRLLPENIAVSVTRANDAPLPVMADRGQLEQVLVNLAINSRDAMPQGGELHINVETETESTGESSIVIRVTDNGAGMTPEIQTKIFEPLFTTKPEGAGTGLGLPVVANIIREHGGRIDVESKAGEGTQFRISLPRREDNEAPTIHHNEILPAGGQETILVVEDNDQVRNLSRLILQGAGYQVMEAADGPEALDLFRACHHEIDLVLLDIVLPHLGGRALVSQMQNLAPSVQLLLTSGYTDADIHLRFIEGTGLEFIAKPFSTDALRARIRGILDRADPSKSRTTATTSS